MAHEGYTAVPYLDEVANPPTPTVGYGTTRILGHPVQLDGVAVSKHAARQLLRADLYGALVDAQALFPRIGEFGAVRAEVVVEMAYQLGRNRLAKFVNMRGHGEHLNFLGMAAEMVHSKWFREQSGRRGSALVKAMERGCWE